MTEWSRLLIGAAFGASIAFAISFFSGFGSSAPVMHAQHSAELDERVSEEDLKSYIEVYSAMQADRSLKIDDAAATWDMSVEEFRALERRVQAQQRLVDRVRAAMLEQAKQNGSSLTEHGVPVHN